MASKKTDFIEGRDAPPSHYLLKIESFSSLSKLGVEKYSSDKFDVGDYKWKLTIYPNGHKGRGGEGHISLVLSVVDTSALPAGWEINAVFNFFIYDRCRDKYVNFISNGQRAFRFHATKLEWGAARFIDLQTFKDPSNGYLVEDACAFGVEVFVLKQSRKPELLSVMDEARTGDFTWKIRSFPALNLDRYESDAFVVGDYKWRIRLYPRGNGEGKGNRISAFLSLDESSLPPDTKLFVKYTLRAMNQRQTKADHVEFNGDNLFGPSSYLAWGVQKFMSLAKLSDPKQMFLVDDTLFIQAQVALLGVVSTVS